MTNSQTRSFARRPGTTSAPRAHVASTALSSRRAHPIVVRVRRAAAVPSRRPSCRARHLATASAEVGRRALAARRRHERPGIESRVARGRHGRGVAVRNLVPRSSSTSRSDWCSRKITTRRTRRTCRGPARGRAAARGKIARRRTRAVDRVLPTSCPPPLEYTELELAACEDPKTIAGRGAEGHLAAYGRKPRLDAVGCDERDFAGPPASCTAGASRTARGARTSPCRAWTCATTTSSAPTRSSQW